jgi:hypothetical protein
MYGMEAGLLSSYGQGVHYFYNLMTSPRLKKWVHSTAYNIKGKVVSALN